MKSTVYILIGLWTIAAPMQAVEVVVFKDSFESHASDTLMHEQSPEIGDWWVENGSGLSMTQNAYTRSGDMALAVIRDSQYNPKLSALGALGDTYEVFPQGEPFYFSVWWYQAVEGVDRPIVSADFGSSEGIARISIDTDNMYAVWNGDMNQYVCSGVSAAPQTWEQIQLILHPGPDMYQGYIHCLYDAYVIRSNGDRFLLGKQVPSNWLQLAIVDGQYVNNNAKLTFSNHDLHGQSILTVYYDDVEIVKNYVPTCGDIRHPSLIGDLNMDCVVDLVDFAIIAQSWLETQK